MRRALAVTAMCLALIYAPRPSAQAQPETSAACPEMATALTALMRNDVRLRDWANMARYRDANATLAAPAGS